MKLQYSLLLTIISINQEEDAETFETDEEQRVSHMSSHRSWSVPAKEDIYESYGFVQVRIIRNIFLYFFKESLT